MSLWRQIWKLFRERPYLLLWPVMLFIRINSPGTLTRWARGEGSGPA